MRCVLRANRAFFPNATIVDRPIAFVRSSETLRAAGHRKGEAAPLIGGPPCQPFSGAGYWLEKEYERPGAVPSSVTW